MRAGWAWTCTSHEHCTARATRSSRQQLADILDALAAPLLLAHHAQAAREELFALLDAQHLLLDALRAHEAHDAHGLFLAHAVHAVDRLRLDGPGPPRVHHEDVLRGREVEADAAGAQREQQDRAVASGRGRGEGGDDGGARFLRHGAIKAEEGYVCAGEGGLDEVKEGGELREDHAFGGGVGIAQTLEVGEESGDLGRRGLIEAAEGDAVGGVVVADYFERVARRDGLAAVEAARDLALVDLVLDVVGQALLTCRVPAARDRLLNHGLFETERALAVCRGLDLLQRMGSECIGVLLSGFCRETCYEILQVHVVCQAVHFVCGCLCFNLFAEDVLVAGEDRMAARLAKSQDLCEDGRI